MNRNINDIYILSCRGLLVSLLFSLCHINAYSQIPTQEDIGNVAASYFSKAMGGEVLSRAAGEQAISNIVPYAENDTTFLYFVNFQGGGWVIVSNCMSAYPVCAYSETGSIDLSSLQYEPDVQFMISYYMEDIRMRMNGTDIDSTMSDYSVFWDKLKSGSDFVNVSNLALSSNYVPRTKLLDKPGVGEVNWGQYKNYDGEKDINRSYNKFCPDFFDCWQGRTYTGCNAVAVAQLMWYWEWPDKAVIPEKIGIAGILSGNKTARHYDWDNMPTHLGRNSSMYEIDMVAGLLRDCGYAAHTIYSGTGSAAVIGYARTALKDFFGYNCNKVYDKTLYNDKEWANLLVKEITANRPVIYHGAESVVSAYHIMVVDGYDSNTNTFHINFGHAIQKRSGYIWYNLSDFNGYNTMRYMLTGIYPRCSNEVAHADVSQSIPSGQCYTEYTITSADVIDGKVYRGGHLIVKAGSQIIFKPGFKAISGSNVLAEIRAVPCDGNVHYAPQSDDETEDGGDEGGTTASADMSVEDDTGRLSVYPNPSESVVYVNAPKEIERIDVYSVGGSLLNSYRTLSIDVGAFHSGVYILQCHYVDGTKSSVKIIKI